MSQWLWIVYSYAEPVVWIMVCYAEQAVLNHVLYGANGFESRWVMLSLWVWFMVWYAVQVVVIHGVLYWASMS